MSNVRQIRRSLDEDLDGLFRLPLGEFTAGRNALAAQLKKRGRVDEADLVKTLLKPPISAWAVNQLYWSHRAAFDRLIAAGGRFLQAQTSRLSRKVADMRAALDARSAALTQLSELATALLQDAGHNPSQDVIRRITTTLEAMSAYASSPDGPRPGRLTQDVDPPGFESLASFVPSAGKPELKKEPARQKAEPLVDNRKLQETRKENIAAAKASLQEAKRVLNEARSKAQTLETAHKKAYAEAREADKQRREAERRFVKAKAESEDAELRVQSAASELEEATEELEAAESNVEKDSKELEKLVRESPTR
jgi:DNA repair exonuclease SbcCD ATPase subunit